MVWESDDGWSLTLIVRPGRGASLSLYCDGRSRLHQTFAWHETARAEQEAETLAALGNMHRAEARV